MREVNILWAGLGWLVASVVNWQFVEWRILVQERQRRRVTPGADRKEPQGQ